MLRPLRSVLPALAAALLAQGALAQPVKVQLPKNAPPKPPREPPAQVEPEQAEEERAPDRRRLAARGRFLLDFDKVEIDKLVQTISDMTGRLFILPENIRGKITIVGPEHGKSEAGVTANEAYAAFLAALDANGLTVYQVGRFHKIVEKRAGKQSNIPTLVDDGVPYTTNEQMITKMFRLRYVEPEPLRAVIQQLVSRDGDTIAFPPDVLIVNDIGLNMHRLEKIVDKLDRASSSDEIRVLQVQYAAATELAERLKQIFEDKSRRPGQRAGASPAVPRAAAQPGGAPAAAGGEEGAASLSQIIADERTNKLIVIANDEAFRRIEGLMSQLDVPVPGEGQVHVYYLENANAEELANTLASLTQGVGGRAARPPTPAGPAAARTQATVADLFSGEMKITADKGTNSLVVIANNNDYRSLVNVIQQLDRARNQVFIEAVIMEVNLTNDKQFGLSVHAGAPKRLAEGGQLGKDDSLGVIASQVGPGSLGGVLSLAQLGGFLAGLQGPLISDKFPIPSFAIVMQALQTNSDVNVLSTPHILTSDNEEAEISVGQNVPFQAGYSPPGLSNLLGGASTTAGTAANTTSNLLGLGGLSSLYAPIQRQNVELRLKIKPQINESDFIRLQIDEQTEEIASVSETLGPTTSKRSAKTTITAKDQQTVVIGGLMQERTTRSVEKTPILGDIPVLGWLFRSTKDTKSKTNLLLFLTPYIVRDQADFQRIFERKMKERQQFVEQFYGRQPGYKVAIDYERKAGPLSKMFKELEGESRKVENGGPGAPGEKMIAPAPPSSRGRPLPITPEGDLAPPEAPPPGAEAPAEGPPAEAPPAIEMPASPEPAEPPPAPELREPPSDGQ